METVLQILKIAVIIFPYACMFVAAVLFAIILIKREEGTISPRELYRIYREKLVFELKNRKHERN